MAQAFISYRREDNAAGDSRALALILRQRLGRREVFRDIHSLEPGEDFPAAISAALAGSSVCFVMIGAHWLTMRADGVRRLDQEGDWVRNEVAGALAKPGVRVVPVLVRGGAPPAQADLPAPLKPLADLNAIPISDKAFEHDVHAMIDSLIAAGDLRPRFWRQPRAYIAAAFGALLLGLGSTIYAATDARCAFIPDPPAKTQFFDAADPAHIARTTTTPIDRARLRCLGLHELRLARNEIFARKGFAFEDPALASHFAQFGWYQAATGAPKLSDVERVNVSVLEVEEHYRK